MSPSCHYFVKLDWDILFPEGLYIHKCFPSFEISQRVKGPLAERRVLLFSIAMDGRITAQALKLKEKKEFGLFVKHLSLSPYFLGYPGSLIVNFVESTVC